MEGVYFALGMAVIIQVLTIMIVYTLKTKIGQLEIELQFLERGSQNVANDIHRRIEDEVRELRAHNDHALIKIEDGLKSLNYKIEDGLKSLDYNIYSRNEVRELLDEFEKKIKKEKNLLKG